MEIRCSACATRYSIADDRVRGRRGKFPCHRCGAKVVIDGTLPASAGGPSDGPPACTPVKRSLPPNGPPASDVKRPLPPVPSPPKAAPPPSQLSGADEEDEATRFLGAFEAPPSKPTAAASPLEALADAIDEDEATRMVSIISVGPASSPRGVPARAPISESKPAPTSANEEVTSSAPLEGPGGLLEAMRVARELGPVTGGGRMTSEAESDDSDATRVGLASTPNGAELLSESSDENDATHVISVRQQSQLAENAKSLPSAAPDTAPADLPAAEGAPSAEAPRKKKKPSAPEVTGQTRIVVRAPQKPATRGLPRMLLLMVVAGVGGFLLSQLMNARHAQAPVRAPTSPTAPAPGFDEQGAQAAVLAAVNAARAECQPPAPSGTAIVANVHFLPNGHAALSKVEDPLGQTEAGLCIGRRLDQVAIAPFSGAAAISVRVAAQ